MQTSTTSVIDAGILPSLQIGGLVPLSTSDYPDHLSAVVFCQGCPWRCRYCHNPHLQARKMADMGFGDLLQFLKKRVGLLDAVVFSGGEPTYQDGIRAAAVEVRKLGFKIGLHTAAPRLDNFREIMPLLDWVGLDIKADPEDYPSVTGIEGSGEATFQALELLLDSGIEFEARTTMHPLLLGERQVMKLAQTLSRLGVRNYALQVFRKNGCQDDELNESAGSPSQALTKELAELFDHFTLRDSWN